MRILTPLALSVACAVSLFSQQPNAATITGRVNDTAGRPIPKATLLLFGGGHAPNGLLLVAQPYRANTAADGTYAFTGIEPGAYNLQTYRAGYATGLLGANDLRDLSGGTLRLTAGQQMAGLNIKLEPAATISGKVTDNNGNGVANAQIALWTPAPQGDGTSRMIRINAVSGPVTADATTDTEGKYSIENLAPGTYYLSAGLVLGGPDISLFDLQGLSATRLQTLTTQPETWATTWFPHAIDSASASPIEVAAGRTVTIDIQLFQTHAYQIEGRLVASSQAPPLDQIHITLLTKDGRPVFPLGAIVQKDGSFVLNNAPAGEYYLRATAPGSGNQPTIGLQKITVPDGSPDVPFNLPAPVEIHGTVTSNSALPPNVTVQFTPAEFSMANSNSVPIANGGTFTAPSLIPGTYRVKVYAPRPDYVKSVAINGTEIKPNATVTLASGPATMQIALGGPTGSIRATIQPDPSGAIARFVTVIPTKPIPGIDWRITWFAPPDELKDLPPGTYRLYAIDAADPSTIPAAALKAYDNQSATVTITGPDPVAITLGTVKLAPK